MLSRSASTLALGFVLYAPALAAELPAAPAAPPSAGVAGEGADQAIVVTGQREEYGVKSTRSATRTETQIKDIPQSLTVISESQIEDQSLRSIADVLTYVPGAMPGTGEGNRDQITLRGNNTTADFFVDGLRDDVQYFRDLYNVDRVEILRGPNAMIFGRGGGGGIVNRVAKQSSFRPYRQLSASADSEGGFRVTADVDHPLGPGAGTRLNGVYEEAESFRRGVELERYGINPVIGLEIGRDTRLDLSHEYFHDRRTADRGLPALNGRPLEGFDRIFFGDPEKSFSDADVHLTTFALEHRFAEGFTLRNRTLYGDYDKYYQNVFPSGLTSDATQVNLAAYNSRNDRTNFISQTDFVWDNRLGGIDQTLLVGFELARQKSRNLRQSGTFIGTNRIPLSDPTIDASVTFAPAPNDANNRTTAEVAALYVQDQIRVSPLLEIVAGLRFDRFELRVNDLRGAGSAFSRTDQLLSPRLGLILKPIGTLSVYASYSRSYLPSSGDQFSGLDVTSQALKPEKFDNYEVGAKWEALPGLIATVALYQLDRTNTRATDPANPARVVLTGAQRSRGIEAGLERNISDQWQISAGYTYQKAEITRATSVPEGREVPLVPRHQFSLWSRHDFTPQMGLGLGIVARSKAYASISNQVILPGYARVDAAAFYKVAEGVEAQVNIENLLGRDYFPTAHNDNNIAPGAPRTARATLRFTF